MRKLQFYKYAVWVLLSLNLGLLAFFFFTKPPHHHKKERKLMRADKRLHLDKAQHKVFLEYAHQHRQQIDVIDEKQRNLLKPYFHTLIDSTQNVDFQKTLIELKELEAQKIESTYAHFKEIKSILRPEQHVYFEAFVDEIFKQMLKSKKRPKRPKDF